MCEEMKRRFPRWLQFSLAIDPRVAFGFSQEPQTHGAHFGLHYMGAVPDTLPENEREANSFMVALSVTGQS